MLLPVPRPDPVLHSPSLDTSGLARACFAPNLRSQGRFDPEWITGSGLSQRQWQAGQGVAANGGKGRARDPRVLTDRNWRRDQGRTARGA